MCLTGESLGVKFNLRQIDIHVAYSGETCVLSLRHPVIQISWSGRKALQSLGGVTEDIINFPECDIYLRGSLLLGRCFQWCCICSNGTGTFGDFVIIQRDSYFHISERFKIWRAVCSSIMYIIYEASLSHICNIIDKKATFTSRTIFTVHGTAAEQFLYNYII